MINTKVWKFKIKRRKILELVGKFMKATKGTASQSEIYQALHNMELISNRRVKYYKHNHELMTDVKNFGKEAFILKEEIRLPTAIEVKFDMQFILLENCVNIQEVDLWDLVI